MSRMRSGRRVSVLAAGAMAFAATAVAAQSPAEATVGAPANAVASHREVLVPTPDAAVTLAGTLSIPAHDRRGVVVVFVAGSGGHTRDQVISGTPMFAEIGAALLAAGYSTLRVDDRGAGASTGPTTGESTTADRVTDMRAVVSWLAGEPAVSGDAVVLLGHSEGAMVAAAVASSEAAVDGVMLLGAPSRSGAGVWIDQQLAGVAAHLGREASELTEIRAILGDVVARSVGGAGDDAIEEAAVALFEATGLDLAEARESGLIAGFVTRVGSPWFRHFLGHDPIDDYGRLRTPVLAVYGTLDRLTSPALNAEPLRAAVEEAGRGDFTLELLADQDHFFLRADHLEPGQHRFGQMHVAPDLLELLVGWLDARY
jgi:uncharacterized protein